MAESRQKSLWKLLAKVAVSLGALAFVFSNIEWPQVREAFANLKLIWLVPSLLLFAISKVFSAIRLTYFFACIPLKINQLYNLRLAWVGMFYNLFLPGGIGGDAYKVFVLHRQQGTDLKKLGAAVLLDRINGVVALGFLACLGLVFIDRSLLPNYWWVLSLTGAFLAFPLYYLGTTLLFQTFKHEFWRPLVLSLLTQGSQVVAAFFILGALGVELQVLEYLVLFLVSSIVAVLPFTIGGVGARELTFILGHDLLQIDQNTAVTFSLLFFLITLTVSAVGGFLSAEKGN